MTNLEVKLLVLLKYIESVSKKWSKKGKITSSDWFNTYLSNGNESKGRESHIVPFLL